ncbi:MAG: glutathione S-transferase [Pseudomonadota bacterium]|nr:glutathione S-transferase [Pseudomonadota bacterium]MEC8203179.1 glutathione S-transferase [Pseudomonadota bacterium]
MRLEDCINETCPWSGDTLAEDSLTVYNARVVKFCNPGCRDKLEPATLHLDASHLA